MYRLGALQRTQRLATNLTEPLTQPIVAGFILSHLPLVDSKQQREVTTPTK